MSATNLRKRLLAVEVRRLGGGLPPPFFDISFEDGGPGGDHADNGPRSLEEYRRRYGCEPPVIIRVGFDEEAKEPVGTSA